MVVLLVMYIQPSRSHLGIDIAELNGELSPLFYGEIIVEGIMGFKITQTRPLYHF